MVCIQCGDKTQVINSRPQVRLNQVWRRRQCLACSTVFTTEESADYSALWLISTANGALEPFSGDKLFLSIYNSIQHRPGAITDARALTDTVIQKLVAHGDGSTVSARTIAGIIQVVLNRFDTAASVHYAAFHK